MYRRGRTFQKPRRKSSAVLRERKDNGNHEVQLLSGVYPEEQERKIWMLMPELPPGRWVLSWKKSKTGSAAEAFIRLGSDEIATKLSSVRALNAAKEKGQDLITVCSACHHVLKRVNDDMKNVEDIRTRANNYMKLDTPYEGETEVLHFLEVLRDRVGFDKVKEKVVNPFKGKKIGAYYGCLLLRPGKILQFDDPENPKIMEDLIRALGGEPVIYPYRNECCGGYISLKEKEMSRICAIRSLRAQKALAQTC